MLARLAGRTRRSPGSACRQRGQVLILFVMGATVIFVIGAIVVDIGLWVSERRNAQAAADLASLAAATQLHNANATGDAQAKGIDFAKRNGFDNADSNIIVEVNPDTTNETVEVTIDEQGVSLFAGIFGITSPRVGASAVAAYGASPPGPDVALFASSSDCNAGRTLDIEANHVTVTGSTHSNANIHIEGPQDSFIGPVTYVCPNGFTEGSQQNFPYQPPPRMVGNQTPPLDLKWTDIVPYCDGGVTPGNRVITDLSLWQDKVICATGDLTLNVNATQARMTLAAQGRVLIFGAGNNLQPAGGLAGSGFDQLLVYSSSASAGLPAIGITAIGGEQTGYIHAPNSGVVFNGDQGVQVNGAIVAKTVLLSGNNIILTALVGLPGPPGPPQVHLED